MTWEPQGNNITDDPYSCAVYAKRFNLLNTPGWKQLKRYARAVRRLIRTLKKSKYSKPRQQKDTSIDGKSDKIMHMPYNLMSKMAMLNGRMLLT